MITLFIIVKYPKLGLMPLYWAVLDRLATQHRPKAIAITTTAITSEVMITWAYELRFGLKKGYGYQLASGPRIRVYTT